MESLVKEILDSPDLGKYKAEIDSFWQAEQALRQKLYVEMQDKSYEFINGKIHEEISTTSEHNRVQGLLFQLLNIFVNKNLLGRVGNDKMKISLTRNDYEPDICFWNKEIADSFTKDQLLFPAPDFIVEVLSKSTESKDRGIKFVDYASHGVREYWLIEPQAQIIEQYKLYQGEFQLFRMYPKPEGKLMSFAVEGFEINAKAIFDEKQNLEAMQRMFLA